MSYRAVITSEAVEIDIPDEMITNAIYEQGGAINTSGHYAISDKMRDWLQRVIDDMKRSP